MDYNLQTLGWKDFQNLCATILREVFGQTYQMFSDTNDAGRDGAFYGTWCPPSGPALSGSFTVQCKFTARSNASLVASDIADELSKARKLAKKGLAENYILMTNATLRAPVEAKLKQQFERIPKLNAFRAYGGEWINRLILENRKIRTLVPRVYGLGDLTEILDERVYEQAKEILSWFGDELEKFVVTDAHHRSVRALSDTGFVFLLGDPGSGKSTIAAALALAAADTWSSRVVKVCSAKDFTSHWNPREPNQFFWVDDAFGQRQYERDRSLDWNHALPHLSAAIKRGARAIFTSRSYIYKAAIEDLKESAFPLLRESRVVIEVEKLTEHEREQILYNQLRLGRQSRKFLNEIKPYLSAVAAHPKFLPETARRLADPLFTKKVSTDSESIVDFVENPDDYLRDVIEGLGDGNRAALGLTFMKGGLLPASLDLSAEEKVALDLLNSSIGVVRKSLVALDGSLILRETVNGVTHYRFKHPTIRDAFGGIVSEDPSLMDVYLRGTRPDSLVDEITCGDVGLTGVKLVAPPDRYSLVIQKLRELRAEIGGEKRVVSFLINRSCSEFLAEFLKAEKKFLQELKLKYWIEWSDEAKLFARLHEFGLLSESQRARFVKWAEHCAIEGPEWRFMLRKEYRALFHQSEIRRLRARVRTTLTARVLKRETDHRMMTWEPEEDPDDHFWIWQYQLEGFEHEFSTHRAVSSRFGSALKKLRSKIATLERVTTEKDGDLSATKEQTSNVGRSVFDDVDEEGIPAKHNRGKAEGGDS